MGMTIDEKIHCLKSGVIDGYDCTKCPYVNKSGCDFNGTSKWALGVIERYQKIKEIVDKWHNDPRMKMTTSYYYMAKITEVLEDGNND